MATTMFEGGADPRGDGLLTNQRRRRAAAARSPMLRARVIESLAEKCNSRVIGSADTEDDAVNGIRDSEPDAVVLDIQLRSGNGLNVLHRLNRMGLTKRPLVIVLTNYNDREFRRHAIAAGTDYYFDKGSEFHRVGEVLNSLQERHPVQ